MDTDLLGTDFKLEISAYSVNAFVLTRTAEARRPGVEAARIMA